MPKRPPDEELRTPGRVPKEVLDYFRAKGLKPAFAWFDVWREEHSAAFTVAKVLERDLLDTVRTIIDRAIEKGTTFGQFQKDVRPTLDRSGWSAYAAGNEPRRLYVIYETNMRQARGAGQWTRMERRKTTHPILEYYLGPSRVHRAQHVAWAGTRLPVDDPFWDTHMPMNGWGCKCGVRAITKAEAERRGGVTSRPSRRKVTWEHPRTGRKVKVPIGIDPGFDYNPGKHRLRALEEALK